MSAPLDRPIDFPLGNRLPFTLSIATREDEVREVCAHRGRLYSKEMPELGERLREPEVLDRQAPGREIIVARSRLDGEIIGSLRVHFNNEGPLPIESCIEFPEHMQGKLIMEGARLCSSAGPVCRSALVKAAIRLSQTHGACFAALTARPRISVIYESVGFKDLFEPNRVFPIPYVNNVEHRVMGMPLDPVSYHAATKAAMKPSVFDFYHAEHADAFDFSKALPMGAHAKAMFAKQGAQSW